MHKNSIVLALVFFLVLAAPAASRGQYIPNAPFKPQVFAAPDFTLKDLQGKTFRMSAQRGRPVLIFFGTTWCPGCRAEIPKYKKVYEEYSPKGMEVIYINIMEPARKVAKFAKANALPYRTLLDEDGSVGAAYNAIGVPMMILVDKDGSVVKLGFTASQMPLDKVLPVK